eukprot:2463205-Rhodomonas_salina.2
MRGRGVVCAGWGWCWCWCWCAALAAVRREVLTCAVRVASCRARLGGGLHLTRDAAVEVLHPLQPCLECVRVAMSGARTAYVAPCPALT